MTIKNIIRALHYGITYIFIALLCILWGAYLVDRYGDKYGAEAFALMFCAIVNIICCCYLVSEEHKPFIPNINDFD